MEIYKKFKVKKEMKNESDFSIDLEDLQDDSNKGTKRRITFKELNKINSKSIKKIKRKIKTLRRSKTKRL